jgi:ABC-type enterobactin transport system permease subunit
MSQIVSDNVYCENQIHQFFQNQKIGSLLKRSNIDKERGISPVAVFRVLFSLAFTGKNLFRTLEAGGEAACAALVAWRRNLFAGLLVAVVVTAGTRAVGAG